MKRIGLWQNEPLPEDAYRFRQAFAMDTLAFSQWLQFVLIPRVQAIVASNGRFPPASMVAVQAIREFDGMDQAAELIGLLCEFDELFNRE